MRWKIEYKNADYGDDGYREWWQVSNDKLVFECESEADAQWLFNVLKEYENGRTKETITGKSK